MHLATRREAILEVFKARLEQIQTANGYATDAGTVLYVGEVPALGESDPNAAIALVLGDEDVRNVQEHVFFHWAIEIGAVVKIGVDEAWRVVEQILADIKQAIETVDRKLDGNLPDRITRGPVRQLPRESGSSVTGAFVTYIVPYPEPWGQPRLMP